MKWPISLRQKLLDGIIEILDNFEYDKVCVTMHFLNWKYVGKDHTPTVKELKEFSIQQIASCLDSTSKYNSKTTTECGGFRVIIDLDGNIELLFILTSWDSGDQG